MKLYNILFTLLIVFSSSALSAQETPLSGEQQDKVKKEVSEKTYTVNQGDRVVKNTVRIETLENQDLKLNPEDSTNVNQSRVYPESRVTKVVWIDNDADNSFDEKLKFSYKLDSTSDSDLDFVLVTNQDKIFIALDKGASLEIQEVESLDKNQNIETMIFTEGNGKRLDFRIESFEDLNAKRESK